MFQDKLRTSDWDATFEAIEQAVSQESYLLWLKEQETKSVNNGGPSRLQVWLYGLEHDVEFNYVLEYGITV